MGPVMLSLSFWILSILYPLNLYIFEFFSPVFSTRLNPQNLQVKAKTLSIITSCLIGVLLTQKFDFALNRGIATWTTIGLVPFILPWIYSETLENDDDKFNTFLFWRNFIIAPMCEELYYRIILPQFCDSILALSISFSLAHAHPLFFLKNWSSSKSTFILCQCGISFCFGFLLNRIRSKSGALNVNIWLLLALTFLHGLANYCGLPIITGSKRINYLQCLLLFTSIYLILK